MIHLKTFLLIFFAKIAMERKNLTKNCYEMKNFNKKWSWQKVKKAKKYGKREKMQKIADLEL